jgi:hypothetical protein
VRLIRAFRDVPGGAGTAPFVGAELTAMSLSRKRDPSSEIAQAIAEAFDQVCTHLHDTGQPELVREVIYVRIANAAKEGEHDPARLRDIVLASFGLKRDAF